MNPSTNIIILCCSILEKDPYRDLQCNVSNNQDDIERTCMYYERSKISIKYKIAARLRVIHMYSNY